MNDADLTRTGTNRSSSGKSNTFDYFSTKQKINRNTRIFFEKIIIPLISETNRTIPQSNLLKIVTYIFLLLQIISGILFVNDSTVNGPEWFKYSFGRALFVTSEKTDDFVGRYIMFIFNLIFFVITTAICIDYFFTNTFNKYELFVLRIVIGHIFKMFIIPSFYSLFNSLSLYCLYPSTERAITAFLNFVGVALAELQFHFIHQLLELNPYIQHLTITHWRTTSIFTTVNFYSIAIGISSFAKLFDKENSHFLGKFFSQIIMFLISFFVIPVAFNFVFEKTWMNSLIQTLGCGCLISPILIIILFSIYDKSERPAKIHIYYLGMLIVCCVIFFILEIRNTRKERKIVRDLSGLNEDGTMMPNLERIKYIESLKLNEKNSFMYMGVGLKHGCPLFLDWSLSTYVLTHYYMNFSLVTFTTWLVSFFPSETSFFQHCISIGSKMPDPPYILRCVFHQLQRVYIFRQSELSSETISDLAKLKEKTNHCIALMSSFWVHISVNDLSIVSKVFANRKYFEETDELWNQMLEKYPNNPVFLRLYSHYLLQAKTKFRDSIIWHKKSELVEGKHILTNDSMFRCLLKQYPFYLKKNIVDNKGNVIVKNVSQKNDFFHQTGHSTFYESTEDNDEILVDALEDVNIIPQIRLKFAFENAVQCFESKTVEDLSFFGWCRLSIAVIFITIIFCLFYNMFDNFGKLMIQFYGFNEASREILILSHEFLLYYLSSFPSITNATMSADYYRIALSIKEPSLFFSNNATYEQVIMELLVSAVSNLDDFARTQYEYYNDGDLLGKRFIESLTMTKFEDIFCCIYNVYKYPHDKSIDYVAKTYATTILQLMNDTKAVRRYWNSSNDFCEVYSKDGILHKIIHKVLFETTKSLTFDKKFLKELSGSLDFETSQDNDEYVEYYASFSRRTEFIISTVPFVLLLIIYPNIVFLKVKYNKERKDKIQLFSSIKKSDALEASKNIFLDESHFFRDIQNKEIFFGQEVMFDDKLFLYIVFSLIVIAAMLTNGLFALKLGKELRVYLEHMLYTIFVQNCFIELTRDSVNSVFLEFLKPADYIIPFADLQAIKKRISHNIDIFDIFSRQLYAPRDSVNGSSVFSWNKDIEDYRILQKCPFYVDKGDLFSYVKCNSYQNLVFYFMAMVKLINSDKYATIFGSTEAAEISYIMESRMFPDTKTLITMYRDIFTYKTKTYEIITFSCFIVEIVLLFVILFIENGIVKSYKEELEIFKSLLLRIDPFIIVNNHDLLTMILGQQNTKSRDNGGSGSKITSVSHAVVQTAKDSMLFLSNDLVIESFNPATTKIFNFSYEQLIGQKVDTILGYDSNISLYYTAKLMSLGQHEMIYKCSGVGITEGAASTVPLQITLIGFEDINKRAKSFAVVLKSTIEIEENKKLVNIAKKKTEMLIKQIIPTQIHVNFSFYGRNNNDNSIQYVTNRNNLNLSLKNNEYDERNNKLFKRTSKKINKMHSDQNIILENVFENDALTAFTNECATAFIIDFDGYSEFTKYLTPVNKLKTISEFFSAFEKIAKNFPLIVPYKIMGDSYIGISGLFSHDLQDNVHAVQAVQFSLKCFNVVEEININLNTSFQIRIGISTGGPFYAGILDKRTPIFSIISNHLILADKLQKTGSPSAIHISEETYNQVNQLPLKFEEKKAEVYDELTKKYIKSYIVTSGEMYCGFELSAPMAGDSDRPSINKSSSGPLFQGSTFISNSGWMHGSKENV